MTGRDDARGIRFEAMATLSCPSGKDQTIRCGGHGLRQEFLSDPRNHVTGSQMQTLFGIAVRELDDEDWGGFSRLAAVSSYGCCLYSLWPDRQP